MKIKKILSLILAVFILLSSIVPVVQAKDNPLYKFPKSNGIPRLVDNEIVYRYDLGNQKNYRIESISPLNYIPIYINKYSDDISYYGSTTAYVYVDTEKFFDNKPTPILDFGLNYKSIVRDVKPGESDIAGMNMIYYDHEKKTIVASLGYVNSKGEGKHSGYNLYHNIDKNTPNFMFLIDIRIHQFINSMGDNELAVSAYVSRETEAGNGILSNERNFLVGSIPISLDSTYNLIKFQGGPSSSFLQYGFYNDKKQYMDHYNPGYICEYLGFSESENFNEYKNCLDDSYSFILEHYFQSWQRDFGLNHSEDTVLGGDPNKPIIKDGIIQIPKIIMDKPQVPTCSFTDSFLGLSCLGEWIVYSFQNLIYFIVSIFNGIIDFCNFVIRFLSGIFNGFLNIFKEFALWIFEGIKSFIWPIFEPILNFFKPVWTDIIKPVWDFFYGFFKPFWELATGKITFQSLFWGNQEYICSKNRGFYIDTETPTTLRPSELLGFFLLFASPFPPQDGSLICTSIGMKQIEYGRSTIVDTTIFLFFIFAGFWFLLFIVRR